MAFFDLAGEALTSYRTTTPRPDGLDAFWAETLTLARDVPLDVTWTPVETGLELVETFDVTFPGFAGQPVRAWLTLPRGTSSSTAGELSAVVEYVGYGGGRGLAHEVTMYALAGRAHLRMDTRGQGSAWSVGHTADPGGSGGPQYPGFMTRGIGSPHDHYYRRVFTDAVRAIETVRSHPAVDATRVAVAGASQGGGITIAAAGLMPDVAAAMPDVPFLCDIRRAVTLVDSYPYHEVVDYLHTHRDQVGTALLTLDHVDGVHLAATATAPSLWSVALMDAVCPPSTVYAAYNAWQGPKRIEAYPYNGHEGGGPFHDPVKLAFLRETLD